MKPFVIYIMESKSASTRLRFHQKQDAIDRAIEYMATVEDATVYEVPIDMTKGVAIFGPDSIL